MRIAALLLLVTTPAVADPAGFTPYRDARALCTEHAMGRDMEIAWSSWASKDDVATVAASYAKATGKAATTGANKELHFDVDDSHKIDVFPADRNGDFPHCDTKPAKGERTVILMSQAMKRTP